MNAISHRSVVLIGAGGHAKVVISTLQAAGYSVEAIFDDGPEKWGHELMGAPIVGPISELADIGSRLALIAVGDNRARKSLAEQFALEWVGVVHPYAYLHPSVQIGPGTVVLAGAVIQPDTHIGSHVIVNTGATIDHDCKVRDYVHLAPGVHLAGGVRVGEGAFLGIGSVGAPGIEIGAWTTVGAGGIVVDNLPSHVVAVGIPARPTNKTR